ncbi:hypothetical protein CRM22_006546 [Opisthorchis felineus]|uniref:Uncharacterized protein n=1 Tax=Opisthorchis felineus TaxID=147828 RepID=A0A4S2LKA6_OPIFE|nr:hypothetical protein CRM22_006546 [Opisthorchis felineus]
MLFFDNRSTFEGPSPQNRFYLHDKGKKTQNDHRMTHHWYSSSLNLVALSGAQLPGGCQNMPSGTPSFHKRQGIFCSIHSIAATMKNWLSISNHIGRQFRSTALE